MERIGLVAFLERFARVAFSYFRFFTPMSAQSSGLWLAPWHQKRFRHLCQGSLLAATPTYRQQAVVTYTKASALCKRA